MSEKIKCLASQVWFILLIMMISIHFPDDIISFFFMAEQYRIVCICTTFSSIVQWMAHWAIHIFFVHWTVFKLFLF
jgi:hypothetical protein